MRLVIKNGWVIDPANNIDGQKDIYIEAKHILAVGDRPSGFNAQKEIDAQGKIVCPGLIDLCARLREPGLEYKATIAGETYAAATAGITTLCHPPNTDPIIDTPAVAELISRSAELAAFATVLPIGALTQQLKGEQLAEMAALKAAGCIGVANVYPFENSRVLLHALEYAATHDLLVFLTPQDPWLSAKGFAHDGVVATRLGLPAIPAAAETVAVARDLALIAQTGARAHFSQLSTALAVHMIGRAQYDGHKISCDVSAHQLFLSEVDLEGFNRQCHVIPPLRTLQDRDGLRVGLRKGTIGALCSDHQPHESDAKNRPFCSTEPGISALETLLPLTLKLVDEGVLTLKAAITRLTSGPARLLRIEAGSLSVGQRADICIFDRDELWTLTPEALVSQGKNSPFIGWQLKGRVSHTIHAGRLVFERKP